MHCAYFDFLLLNLKNTIDTAEKTKQFLHKLTKNMKYVKLEALLLLIAMEYSCPDEIIFGHSLREKYFFLMDSFTNLNQGSYGVVPKPVHDAQTIYFLQQESHPDHWFRVDYYKLMVDARRSISLMIHSDIEDTVLVENASAAVNSILRSLRLEAGDKILILSTAYGMVVETLTWLVNTVGIEIVVCDVLFPLKDDNEILESVRSALRLQHGIKLAIFSHISSMPSLIEPVKQLTEICHEFGVSVIIDGAHAPGILNIDVTDINPEFYLGNCHKWMFAPKGTAFLWVKKQYQDTIRPQPTVISSSGQHDFIGRYAYTGTRDYTAFAAIPAAMQFQLSLGGSTQISNYLHKLVVEASLLLASAWNTSLLVSRMESFITSM